MAAVSRGGLDARHGRQHVPGGCTAGWAGAPVLVAEDDDSGVGGDPVLRHLVAADGAGDYLLQVRQSAAEPRTVFGDYDLSLWVAAASTAAVPRTGGAGLDPVPGAGWENAADFSNRWRRVAYENSVRGSPLTDPTTGSTTFPSSSPPATWSRSVG